MRYKSFSQEGEDKILSRIFEKQRSGFYVDIGSHHPIRYSNTFLFYLKGWKGINVDVDADLIKLFNKARKNDVNINAAVSQSNKPIKFYFFKEKALNTGSEYNMKEYIANGYEVKEIKTVDSLKLESILQKFLPKGVNIDFLNIDVEGLDLEVLMSNNWELYKPKVILVESRFLNVVDVVNGDIYKYLSNLNYLLISKTPNTLLFKYDGCK